MFASHQKYDLLATRAASSPSMIAAVVKPVRIGSLSLTQSAISLVRAHAVSVTREARRPRAAIGDEEPRIDTAIKVTECGDRAVHRSRNSVGTVPASP